MQSTKKLIIDQLSPYYSREEITSFTKLIFEKILGLTALQIHLNPPLVITAANLAQIKEILNRLTQFEPIQYILGETEFYNVIIKVNKNVLIPRPETEELVDWIIKENTHSPLNILDIGTGSGCIPIALLISLPHSTVSAWDISEQALILAAENAKINKANIIFKQVDILQPIETPEEEKFDLIISNPPYVTKSEMVQMEKNVTNYEPHLALFVSDNDPLIFYRAIADIAKLKLKPSGRIYFEINERFGTETTTLLASKGFKEITIKKDINGKDRMIRGTI